MILTKYPAGDNDRLWAALVIAFLAAIAAGLLNGLLIGRLRLNPIVATLGTNALLFGVILWYTAGIPTTTTARLHSLGSAVWWGIPAPVFFAVAATAVVTAVVKLTPAGRRFEGLGQTRPRRSRRAFECSATARVRTWAQLLYCLGAVLHASIVNQPTAYEGNDYLLPTVAAVVLGGTSLLGGRGNLVATAVAAPFSTRPVRPCARSLVCDQNARASRSARRWGRAVLDSLAQSLRSPWTAAGQCCADMTKVGTNGRANVKSPATRRRVVR